MTNQKFDPKSIINMQGLYRKLINPENKKSRLNPDNIPKKHEWEVNSLFYFINQWETFIKDYKNENSLKTNKK